ncbi:hypothetical protein PLICRDRAFT_700291 [Plicaturopsis crispa FD-325 SS-3]|nr:hypothetical protein PLICRDRAFT_700291 [Plicaturopsis crispa FD-325 SS-3]
MHHCLQISEILSQVCGAASLDVDGTVRRVDLARLARTCRAFRDPALDVLWHTLPSLDPLIRTLPTDLWRIPKPVPMHRDGIEYRAFEFRRPVKEADWKRFYLYARRVRVFNFNHPFRERYVNYLDASVLSALLVSVPTLLPNLQTLALGNGDSELVYHLGMLLHPKLTSFSIVFESRSNFPRRLSLLTSLPLDSSLLVAAVSRIVGTWSGLTQLDIPGLTPQAIVIVSALPSLRSLRLRLEGLELASDTQHTLVFPSLRSLDFSAPSLNTCTTFISLLPPKHPLHTVKISLTGDSATPELYRSFFEAVAEHCSPLALKFFDLLVHFTTPPVSVVNMMDILTPLLPCHLLERLCVPVPAAVTFTDPAVRTLAVSWPRLRVLKILSGYRNTPGACGVSATMLADLVASCPSLCALSIPVDMAAIADARIKTRPSGNTNLRTLTVGHSTVPDIAGTAALLSEVCPNLDVVYALRDWDSWLEVTKLVTKRRQKKTEINDHTQNTAPQ